MAKAKFESKLDPDWEDKPEWRRKVDHVTRLKIAGYDVNTITTLTGYVPMEVNRIFEDDRVNRAIAKKNFEEAAPTIKDIIGLGLNALKATLEEMVDENVRRKMIGNVRDLASLTKVIGDLNNFLRIDQGQSTMNLETHSKSFQETRHVFQELRKKDPVFDYPQIPEAKVEDETEGNT